MALFEDLIKFSSQFVERQKGIWDHNAWLGFLLDVQKTGIALTDEMQNYLGLILESMRKL